MADIERLRGKLEKLATRMKLFVVDLEDMIADLAEEDGSSTAIVPVSEYSTEDDDQKAAEDEETGLARKRTRRRYPGTVADLVQSGLLKPGEILSTTSRKYLAQATVDKQGRIIYLGKPYDTPTEAGKVVYRQYNATTVEVAGWDFWCVIRAGVQISLKKLRNQWIEMKEGA